MDEEVHVGHVIEMGNDKGIGSCENLHNSHDDNENFLEVLSSKTLVPEMFDPACDYLKKLDNGWELACPSSLNHLEKQLSLGYNGGLFERERLSTLSDLTRGSGRGSGTSERKKKRFEDSSDALFKKSKHESPIVSSFKLHAPKVNLGDRITALQQILSPFGKPPALSGMYKRFQK